MARVCMADGCPDVVERGYCPRHARKPTRSPSSHVTGTHRWRVVKLGVLRRDRYVCHYCGDRADTVDHVRPVSRGGAHFAEANLVAACTPCNLKKGARPHARH